MFLIPGERRASWRTSGTWFTNLWRLQGAILSLLPISRGSMRWARGGIVVLCLLAFAGCEGSDPDSDPPGTDEPTARKVSERMGQDPAAPVAMSSMEEAQGTEQAEMAFFFVPSRGFAYIDDDGHLTGVTVELLRDFASFASKTLDIDVNVTWIEEELWADFYGYVRDSSGAAFGIGNVTITPERAEELDFSPPYMQNVAILVTHQDVPELESLETIAETFGDLVALRYPGTLHEDRLVALQEDHFPGMSFEPVASNDELVEALSAEPNSFGYIDIYNFWRAREAGAPLRRHEVGDDAGEEFGVILPHDSDWTPLMEAFFRARDGIVGTEAWSDRLRTHLGDELSGLLSG